SWHQAKTNVVLGQGAVIRSHDNSTADLFLPYSGTVLRLIPNSTIKVDSLELYFTGVENMTQTRLLLMEGSLVGSQSKLPAVSSFSIVTAKGEVSVNATEYVVRNDGAVSSLSGSVKVIYNLPNNNGSVQVTLQPGQSFDPKTGTVVPTTAAFLQNSIAHVTTVQQNAETYKANGATVVIKPEPFVSPTTPNG